MSRLRGGTLIKGAPGLTPCRRGRRVIRLTVGVKSFEGPSLGNRQIFSWIQRLTDLALQIA